jgi:hypothetical protein
MPDLVYTSSCKLADIGDAPAGMGVAVTALDVRLGPKSVPGLILRCAQDDSLASVLSLNCLPERSEGLSRLTSVEGLKQRRISIAPSCNRCLRGVILLAMFGGGDRG